MKHHYACIDTLRAAGISYDDATALRRISMTLHRWHELECGDGNDYGSWCITRGRKEMGGTVAAREAQKLAGHRFVHDDDGTPFLEHHYYRHGAGKDSVSYTALPDRERGALKRLKAVMARYPDFQAYVQGDPRGAALYIIRSSDIPALSDIAAHYSRGIAVHK